MDEFNKNEFENNDFNTSEEYSNNNVNAENNGGIYKSTYSAQENENANNTAYNAEQPNSYQNPNSFNSSVNQQPMYHQGYNNPNGYNPHMMYNHMPNPNVPNMNNMPNGQPMNQGFNNMSPNPMANPQSYVTIKNSEEQEKKKKKFKKNVKIAVAVVACCASVGVGLGFGYNTSNKFTASKENEQGLKFQFPDTTASADSKDNTDDNVILTGTNTIAPIINKVKDSVVNISIKTQSTNFFNQVYESTGAGSGIIFEQDDKKVYILTNNHVIDGASSVQISITGTEQVNASLVGKDASSDLALIYVLKSDLQKAGINEVKCATFADSDQMEVGEYVLAVGNALGEGKTVTQGIISAQNKEINIDGKKLTVLQTDAAINPGNSGGALINTDGEVVGINTAKLASSSVEGIGYAIPSSYAKKIVSEIKENGSIERPYLGISGFTINDKFKATYNLDIDGVFLSKVEENSAAANAGLRYTDIITGFNGEKITTIEQLSEAISKCKVNDTVTIDFIRNGTTEMSATATLSNYNQNF